MPSLLDIRRRIRSVKNTQQLTKAMKTVSAAKLRRAQERVFSARPYAEQLKKVLGNLDQSPGRYRASAPRSSAGRANPVRRRYGGPRAYAVRSIRIFCARLQGFCVSIVSQSVTLATAGRKGRDFFRRRGISIRSEFVNIFSKLDYGNARDIAEMVMQAYSNAEVRCRIHHLQRIQIGHSAARR